MQRPTGVYRLHFYMKRKEKRKRKKKGGVYLHSLRKIYIYMRMGFNFSLNVCLSI